MKHDATSEYLFNKAKRLFFAGKITEAVNLVNESNEILAVHYDKPNFFKANTKRMFSAYDANLPDIPYVKENEDIIRILLCWHALNRIKPKYQLFDILPNVPITWPQWDEEVLPTLNNRVHVNKRRAVDLLYYLLSYVERQYILDTISERNDPELLALITDPSGVRNRVSFANAVKPSDLPPFGIGCSCYVDYIRFDRYSRADEERYGKVERI